MCIITIGTVECVRYTCRENYIVNALFINKKSYIIMQFYIKFLIASAALKKNIYLLFYLQAITIKMAFVHVKLLLVVDIMGFIASGAWGGRSSVSPGASSSSGSSWRSGTPSPPPVSSSFSDEGIAMDYEDLHPRKKRVRKTNQISLAKIISTSN